MSLELPAIRSALIRQEDTIIFALIERAQFKANAACYEAGRAPYTQLSGSAERSFLDHMLLETERVHGRVRRYTAPDEFPFFPEAVPPPELPVDLDAPALLHPCAVNLNAQIRAVYERRALPAICEAGDDGHHGSSVVADVACLQAISKRVHYGVFVAESKYRAQPEEYARLIQARDEAGIMKLLTNTPVEERILQRVRQKAAIFGQDVQVAGVPVAASGAPQLSDSGAFKVDPEAIVALYRDHIIPITKEVEVQYLLQRLGDALIACHGAPSSAPAQAARRAFASEGKPPPALLRCASVREVFDAVECNKAFRGVVLLERGEAGVHAPTRALLRQTSLAVVGEVTHTRSFYLASRVPLSAVRVVRGHSTALRLCAGWLARRLGRAVATEEVEEESERLPPWYGVLDDGDYGAAAFLCASGTDRDPSLSVIVEASDDVGEAMRCVVVSKRRDTGVAPSGADKCLVLFGLADRAGQLAAALGAFNAHGVNLSLISSSADAADAPAADPSGSLAELSISKEKVTSFYVELQGHELDPNVAAALDELRASLAFVKVLGSFPAETHPLLLPASPRGWSEERGDC